MACAAYHPETDLLGWSEENRESVESPGQAMMGDRTQT